MAPAAESANVSDWPLVGAMLMLPPAVDIVALEFAGLVTVKPLAPPPEFNAIAEAPVALMAEAAPMVNCGVLTVSDDPEATVWVVPPATEIDAPVACELKLTAPAAPAL